MRIQEIYGKLYNYENRHCYEKFKGGRTLTVER